MNLVFTVFWVFYLIGIPLGPFLMRKTTAWILILISCILTCGGMFLAAITAEYWLFILFLGICSGSGLGLAYMSTILICFEYYSEQRYLIWFLSHIGQTIGAFIFSILWLVFFRTDEKHEYISVRGGKILN